ncbi:MULTISPECIES: glycoside hydrolase family 3 N-terminal domain-containing protein [Streptomyces]|uniref:Beta-xylosidase n=1 Tax=Streptomyces thermodiastaticus TaxID=44061 RepID=A0ABU0KFB0_9ACTN|nr:glycosyl hydrolase [Streptomyces sp. McG7]MBT2907736.1 glycosyl hydrolase [Streptomyces sp. McG8]MDQ0487300.1 beta-xylosidase [Streptomyces thermodiastaticus]MYW52526.1 glycosyl hydrolase [Streptomyces sp. SID8376]UVT08008.1 glycoside hydrolase family 3 C-terminal domain-containing protein [Streptomyces thermocarboxydus]WSB39588.1 glycoside hydrolase family 3 C-terminal domain-containing protein [Streptomyces cellulosae]
MNADVAAEDTSALALWNDPTAAVAARVDALIAAMTLEEKTAQLFGVWVGASADGGEVAPHQHEMEDPVDLDALLPTGLGQLTRPFGTVPVDPALGALSLARTQARIAASNRFRIPALAHDECLAGFAAWGATAYPVPLSWGAAFDPDLVRRMAAAIGRDMRSVGVHQGLAPVLDVVRDARWGRVEETIGEDPYLVGTIGTAYVQGLESAGVVATLKHFAGYSASRAGRNLAPASMGPRERADVVLPPFEMAIREGGARSVMNAYTDTDGVPSAADESLLTGLLRDTWGFDGTVVADYFAVAFLTLLHGVAADWADAAGTALRAGIDVELPNVKTYGAPLTEAVADGRVPEELVDRALRRILTQKIALGLLDPDWDPVPAALDGTDPDDPESLRGRVDLDSAENRALARTLAEEAVVLLSNDGILPLDRPRRIALIGPNADEPTAVLGCYSFPQHIGVRHPGTPLGIGLPTLRETLTAEFPDADITYVRGTGVDDGDLSGLDEAVWAAREADVTLVALGDRAGLFGRGTSGEGCDAETLDLPGAQQQLLDALLDTGTPVVTVLLAGRPYALGRAVTESAAIVQSFFPGEEGTHAIAGVLSGRFNPSGRLPIGVPRAPGSQPSTYLGARLAQASEVSNVDPTPAFPFGHGLSYTRFDWTDLTVDADEAPTDGEFTLTFTVRNTGDRSGTEVVQLYLHDPVASVVQPVQRLVGYTRVTLEPGEARRLTVTVPADLASFTGRDGRRVVEPGALELRLAASSANPRLTSRVALTGAERHVDHTRRLHATFVQKPAAA